jgi:hypothetical protein
MYFDNRLHGRDDIRPGCPSNANAARADANNIADLNACCKTSDRKYLNTGTGVNLYCA